MEENVSSWCERKNYSLVCKKSLFLVKELMYSLSTKEHNWSLINRQGCKEFNGLDPRGSSPIGREEERAPWEECNLKVAGTLGGSPL